MKTLRHDTDKHPDPVVVRIGQVPLLWNDPAVFLANLECIFFGDSAQTREIIDNLVGFEGYGTRLVPLLGLLFRSDDNLLIVRKEPAAALVRYFTQGLGLTIPRIETLPASEGNLSCSYTLDGRLRRLVREHPAGYLDGYVTDARLVALANELGKRTVNTYEACRDANDKVLFFRFLAEAGLPRFDGGEAAHLSEVHSRLIELRRLGYRRAVVRSPLGASGFGMSIVSTEAAELRLPEHFFAHGSVLVHGWIETGQRNVTWTTSPSVQFACHDDGRVTLFDITEQLLSQQSVHEGNLSPPLSFGAEDGFYSELIRQAVLTASWVVSTGYRGTGSIDFLVIEQNDSVTVYPCEINARVTGATYPSFLAASLHPGGSWLMRNLSYAPCTDVDGLMEIFEGGDALFLPGNTEGMVPVNIICGDDGRVVKSQLMFLAETPERCGDMIERFPAMLPGRCRFDRD